MDRELLDRTAQGPRAVIVNKCDLPAAWSPADLAADEPIEISLLTGAGTEAIRPAMLRALNAGEPLRDAAAIGNVRQIGLFVPHLYCDCRIVIVNSHVSKHEL